MQLQGDSRGKVNILEGVIVRNELYEHLSNSMLPSQKYEWINESVCVCVCASKFLFLKSCVLMPKDSLHDQNM